MKSILQQINLARGVILFALAASIVLVAQGWRRTEHLAELSRNLNNDTPKLVKELVRFGHRHTALEQRLSQ